MLMAIAEFLPDLPAFNGGAGEALNVFASSRSYRPFPALSAFSTTPLSARAQGAFYTRASDGTARQFAGDATRLYLLSATAWGNVSRLAGGARPGLDHADLSPRIDEILVLKRREPAKPLLSGVERPLARSEA